jgi:AAA+ ATPase superfamily predicted ATPase
MVMFVNRKEELEFLNRKWKEDKANLIIIYGRRRVGKTMLIKNFLENKKGIYVLLTNDSMNENLNELKKAFSNLTGKEYFKNLDVGLVELFRYLRDEIKDDKVVIALDEFQYLMQLNKGVLSIFQKIWDEILADTKVFLIICGSSIGMMESILEYKSPLYGRRTGQWKLNPFNIRGVREMFPRKNFEELIKIYAIFGGTPFYLAQVDENLSVEENIKQKILRKGELLYEEPEFLLREELREPRVYKLILKYIALDYNTLGKLADVTGLDRGNLSKYIETLERLDILGYHLPYKKRKRGIYYIKDNFINFWFRFVYPNMGDLEIGNVDDVYNKILDSLNEYYGKMFENLVFEMLKLKIIDFGQKDVAKWWHKGEEIDVLAYNDEKMIAFEVKWKDLSFKEAKGILKDLERKLKIVDFDGEKECYIVAKSIERKEELKAIDLKDLERFIC